jgi:NADPH-dependent 2,4-dienoyl-CoA reductase/sulfur reductase-like enzyme
MIRDTQTTYSLKQAITAVGATDSTNTIDQKAAGDAYQPAYIVAQVAAAFASGGAATLTVSLVTDSSPAFNVAPVTTVLANAIPVASLAAGYVLFKGQLPQGQKQYRKLVFTVGTAAMTAGTVTAFETLDIQSNR